MPSTFPDIDFRFRRGTLEGYKNTSYVEGSLNFTKDEEMMYVHKDGVKIRISDIVLDAGTEAQIRAIDLPKNKIYLASDTYRMMWFNRTTLTWEYVNKVAVRADVATKAEKDINGNAIARYYYPRSEAEADYNVLNARMDAIDIDVASIVRFDTVVVASVADLPSIGKKGTIYLVPISSYYGYDDLPTPEEGGDPYGLDTHVELLYVSSDQYGGFYEVIGNTTVSLDDYYTKEEVDALLEAFRQNYERDFANYQSDVENVIDGLRTTLNSFMSSVNNKFAEIDVEIGDVDEVVVDHRERLEALETRATNVEGRATALEGRATNLEARVTDLEERADAMDERIISDEQDLADLTSTVDDNKEDIEGKLTAYSTITDAELQRISDKLDQTTQLAEDNADLIDALETDITDRINPDLTSLHNSIDFIMLNYARADQRDDNS